MAVRCFLKLVATALEEDVHVVVGRARDARVDNLAHDHLALTTDGRVRGCDVRHARLGRPRRRVPSAGLEQTIPLAVESRVLARALVDDAYGHVGVPAACEPAQILLARRDVHHHAASRVCPSLLRLAAAS